MFSLWSGDPWSKITTWDVHEVKIWLIFVQGSSPSHFMILPIGSMVLVYMVTWIPSIYPLYVSIYTSTMDPMGYFRLVHYEKIEPDGWRPQVTYSHFFSASSAGWRDEPALVRLWSRIGFTGLPHESIAIFITQNHQGSELSLRSWNGFKIPDFGVKTDIGQSTVPQKTATVSFGTHNCADLTSTFLGRVT